MKIIGLCRFSYPASGGFQVEHDNIDARMAYLWSEERMQERFRQFECLCLPSIAGQTDPDFTLLILVGEAMPPQWRNRLDALVSKVPQARIVARPPAPHRRMCQSVLNEARAPGQTTIQFRHDDDDAVALDFVGELRAVARDCKGLLARNPLVGFDWHRGYIAQASASGLHIAESYSPYWGVAQAVAVQPGAKLGVMNFAHRKIAQFMPTVTFAEAPAYLRGHNPYNDSRQKATGPDPALTLLDAEGESLIRERFGVDASLIRERFQQG